MSKDFIQLESSVFKNLEHNNLQKIINFLQLEASDYLEDIVNNYLDLFLIDYEEFVKKYNTLKEIYGTNFLNSDISLLENIYIV